MKILPYRGGRYQADGGMINGKRARAVFSRKKDAELWLDDRRKDKLTLSLGVSRLAPKDAVDAQAALEILDGLTTLAAAARYWRDHNAPENARRLGDTIKTFLDHLQLRESRPRYLAGMRHTLEQFRRESGDSILAGYTPERILEWLRRPEWSKATFANRRRELSVFFNWCVKQDFIRLNPVARIPAPKVPRHTIDVLTPDEAKALLRAFTGRQRVYFAIALVAGLRPGEIDRLTWQDVKLGRGIIDVSGDAAKTMGRRPVKIQPGLWQFLKEAPHYGPEDFILRCDKHDMMKATAHAIGRENWPQNICRHSFGSYHLEQFGDMNETALQMGHTSTAMLFKFYRAVVNAEDAAEFWAIQPSTSLFT